MYDKINMTELTEEVERLDSQQGDFLENFVRMPEKEGFLVVRLLPPRAGKKFYCATRTHRIHNRSIHCPRVLIANKMGKKCWCDEDPTCPCVVCKYYSDLWKQSENKEGKAAEVLQNQARAIKPVERYYYNCIVRHQINKAGVTEKNVGPKILSIGKMLHDKIVRAIVGDASSDEKPLGDVTDINTGRDFKIIKKLRSGGRDAYPTYDESKFLDPNPLGENDQVEKWMSQAHDLSALRRLRTTEEMKVELKKHLGLIQDGGFDLSEFKPQPVSLEEQVKAAAAPAKPKEDKPAPADIALADDEFLEGLDEFRTMK